MRRILVALCMIVSTAGCVNLGKPEKVAECAANNSCVNSPKPGDAGSTSPDADAGGAADKPPSATSDTRTPVLDGSPTNDDTGTTTGQPDAPPDLPRDQPGAGDLPVILADAAVDARDAAPDLTAPDTMDAYRDVAVGICASGGVVQPAGTVCRAAAGPCDIEETCDGVTADCPADQLAAAGTVCRAAAGACDTAETCSGTSVACPADVFKQAGTVCRPAAGVCDVAESCTGTSATCPVDSLASSSTVCRASTDGNHCDPAENCTGSSVSCPSAVIYTAPAVPGSPSATAGTNQVTVSWSAAVGATGYNVKRSTTSGSGYTTLGRAPTTSASPYLDSGIAAGTYYYVVSSINTIATCESANSSQIAANPVGPCVPPLPPTVTATPGNNTVVLTWPAVSGAVSYTIARSQTAGTGYATLGSPTPASGTTYTDGQVVNGNTYYYVVTASDGSCSSGNSTEVSASPACTPPNAPAAPTATATINSVRLTWNAPATATTYQVMRSTTSGSGYTLLQNVGVTTFTDTTVVTGTTYYYVVTASNGFCSSAPSPQVTVTPSCVPPSAPTVTATPSNNQVTLSWTAPSGATSYLVYRGTTSGGESSTAVSTPATTNYVDTNVSNNSTYYYVVAASNGSCASSNSMEVSATPVCTPPSAPGALTATPGDAQVSLSWVATTSWGSAGTNTYSISRKTGSGGTYAVIVAAQLGASYTDNTGLTNNTTYYYKVSASNGSCSSGFDAEVPATPVAACSQGAPGTPTVTMTTGTQVKLTWTAASPAPASGYNIGRSTNSTTGYTSIGSVSGSTLTFTDPAAGLAIGTTYYYQITAAGASCSTTSATGQIVLACQTPSPPATVTATNNGTNGQITVTWSTSTGATAYTLSRGTASGGPFAAIAGATNISTATYTDSGLANATTYYYVVSASNASGACASANSTAVGSARSCTIPAAPTGVSARRSGNKQVTLVWTNSTGATSYKVQRSDGYSVGTTSGSPYSDTTATNTTSFTYVLSAASDTGGVCGSGNSSPAAAVPSCTVWPSGTHSQQLSANTAEWCVVTCADISSGSGYAQPYTCGSRTPYFNGTQVTCGTTIVKPAKANGGYAFYFTAAGDGGYVGAQIGNVVSDANCP